MLIDDQALISELTQLQQEHQDLNQIIDDPNHQENFDQVTILRLKKRKLFIKDKIKKIESLLYPDIIA